MKGMVFNIFSDLVSERFGLHVWDELIERTQPESEAIYTSGEVYPDGELIAYVGTLSELTGTPAADLVRAFGTFMMHRFHALHPEFMADHNARSFLQSVHDVVHVEVKKLHPDTLLPEFTYTSKGEQDLTMYYNSQRRLCHLAEGLIIGTSEVFREPIRLSHAACMHEGASHCRLELGFG